MKRRGWRLAATTTIALALALALAFAWTAGCALVIDLGDESKLRPAEAGVDAAEDTSTSMDSGAPDVAGDTGGVETFVCGLRQSANKACSDCVQKPTGGCCEESKACALDPACVAGLECVKDCMVQFNCLLGCFGNATLQGVTSCSQNNCPVCVPQKACEKLGACGVLFGDAGGELVVRTLVRNLILEVDEDKCKAQHRDMFKYSTAPQCLCNDAGECGN